MYSNNKDQQKISLIRANSSTYNQFIIVCGFAGASAAIVKTVVSAVFFHIGFSEWFNLLDSGAVIYRSAVFKLDIWHLLLAMITYALWGGILAIGLGLLYLYVGSNNYLIIGSVYGFFIWITFRNFLVSISLPQGLPPLEAASITVSLPSHMLWGAITGYIIIKKLSSH